MTGQIGGQCCHLLVAEISGEVLHPDVLAMSAAFDAVQNHHHQIVGIAAPNRSVVQQRWQATLETALPLRLVTGAAMGIVQLCATNFFAINW